MKAILQNGFLALAIVLAQAIPASAQSHYNKRECIAELKKAKRDTDSKHKGQYVFSKSDRNSNVILQ